MKFIALFIFLCISNLSKAQFISFRATNATGIVSDNLFTSDISKSLGAEIYFSKPMNLIPFNYNLGLNYQYADGVQSAYAITGLSFIIYTPSGFSAMNVESVSYSTFNWLNYADVNLFNGVQITDSTTNYAMAAELGYNIGFVLNKSLLISTGFGGRYNYIPANKETIAEFMSVDFMLKLGMIWKLGARRFKP
jgi:hypothetical protein